MAFIQIAPIQKSYSNSYVATCKSIQRMPVSTLPAQRYGRINIIMKEQGGNKKLKDALEVYGKYKPWWCQPWSILLTGCCIIGLSTVPFQGIFEGVVVGGVTISVFTWWYLFLVIYPQDLLENRRQGKDDVF